MNLPLAVASLLLCLLSSNGFNQRGLSIGSVGWGGSAG
jgi:hypothetical protein